MGVLSCITIGVCGVVLAGASVHDVRTRTIPNGVVLALLVLRSLLVVVAEAFGAEVERFGLLALGGSALVALGVTAVLGGCALLFARRGKQAIGGGDIKLMAALLTFLTLNQALVMLLVASAVGLVCALAFQLVKRDQTFPFAPAISLGFVCALVLF